MSIFEHKPKYHFSPKNFFLHIGALVSLYASIILFLTLVYGIITLAVGESFYVPGTLSSIRFGISGLIVALPIYFIISRLLGNMYREEKNTITSHTKRWSSYLTLFLAGLVLAIDLIVVVNFFLEGDTSTAFILKALAVLVVLGSVFWYQLKDLKRENYSDKKVTKKFTSITSIVVIIFIVIGFVYAGSPGEVRKQERDQERIRDVQNIQSSLTNYWQEKGEIPDNLSDVIDPLSSRSIPKDPNGDNYVYTKTGEKSFTICATFETEQLDNEYPSSYRDYYEPYNKVFFNHGIGNTCFDREIDEDIYPVNKNQIRPQPVF